MINQVKKQLETSFANLNKKVVIDEICAKVHMLLTCSSAISEFHFRCSLNKFSTLIDSSYKDILSYEPEKKEE